VEEPAPTDRLAGGSADGLLRVYDAYADRLYAYALGLLDEAGPAVAAVRDALLVAPGAVAGLADPSMLRPWLYALVRNECLRRGEGVRDPAGEVAELVGRHRLAPEEVAAVTGAEPGAIPLASGAAPDDGRAADGWAADGWADGWAAHGAAGVDDLIAGMPHDAGAYPVLEAAPAELREAVAAAAGRAAAGHRAALLRRAQPFDPDGFPVPLDRRRLSSRALASAAAAVVLLAVGLLVAPPIGGGAPAGGVAAPVPAPASIAASLPSPLVGAAESASTLATPATVPRPVPAGQGPAPVRETERRAAPPPARSPSRSTAAGTTKGGSERTALTLSWSAQAEAGCADGWTADLRARALGPNVEELAGVTAVVTDGGDQRAVALRPDGAEWSAEVAGLPTDREVVVDVRATAADGGTVGTASRRLAWTCG